MRSTLLAGLGTVLLPFFSTAQIWLESTQLDSSTVAKGLEVPWNMEMANADTILFSELGGAVKRVQISTGIVKEIYRVPDLAREGQCGLMGLQLHPGWPNVSQLLISYTYFDSLDIKLRVEKLTYSAAQDTLIAPVTILDDLPSNSSNLGCRMYIDSQSKIYLTYGDLKDSDAAQDLESIQGKILRYNFDGTIPIDNPIENSPIWSYGHRNPQGILETPDRNIFISEHGAFTADELNLIEEGENFGWPLISGYCTEATQDICDSLNIVEPLFEWTPTIAPAGIDYYDNEAIPEWRNSILIAALKGEQLWVAKLRNSQLEVKEMTPHLTGVHGRLRDVLVAEDGTVFISTSNEDEFGEPRSGGDRIVKLTPSLHSGIDQKREEQTRAWHHAGQIHFDKSFRGQVSLYAVDGKLLGTKMLSGQQQWQFETTPGVYFLRLSAPTKEYIQKLIIH